MLLLLLLLRIWFSPAIGRPIVGHSKENGTAKPRNHDHKVFDEIAVLITGAVLLSVNDDVLHAGKVRSLHLFTVGERALFHKKRKTVKILLLVISIGSPWSPMMTSMRCSGGGFLGGCGDQVWIGMGVHSKGRGTGQTRSVVPLLLLSSQDF